MKQGPAIGEAMSLYMMKHDMGHAFVINIQLPSKNQVAMAVHPMRFFKDVMKLTLRYHWAQTQFKLKRLLGKA